jgi:hypothetical protein
MTSSSTTVGGREKDLFLQYATVHQSVHSFYTCVLDPTKCWSRHPPVLTSNLIVQV